MCKILARNSKYFGRYTEIQSVTYGMNEDNDDAGSVNLMTYQHYLKLFAFRDLRGFYTDQD